DGLPGGLRLDHLHAGGAAVHRRGRDHLARSVLCAAGPARPSPRPAGDRKLVRAVFDLEPFALGTVVGGIAAGRVPVGNAAGDLLTSWLNPTSVMIGALAVAPGGYLAAVYLVADAHRLGERTLERDFRARTSGICAGALALAGLVVVRSDAPPLFHGLTSDGGAVMVAVSAAAGLMTLFL